MVTTTPQRERKREVKSMKFIREYAIFLFSFFVSQNYFNHRSLSLWIFRGHSIINSCLYKNIKEPFLGKDLDNKHSQKSSKCWDIAVCRVSLKVNEELVTLYSDLTQPISPSYRCKICPFILLTLIFLQTRKTFCLFKVSY